MTIRVLLTICILFGGIRDVQGSSPVIETEELDVVDYVLPAGLALFSNLVFWVWGLTVLQAEYSEISPSSIATNFREGWEWDEDAFATNQLGHPYQGQLYYGAARASGHSYWVSSIYTFFGSLQWEYFMETERPSYNDLITTTFGGVAVGEALFRLSSHMLEPSASGGKRFVRELAGLDEREPLGWCFG